MIECMNSYTFAIHDLNNKLMALYGLIRKYEQGTPPPNEKMDAVIERINEIMRSLYLDYRPELIAKKSLESMNQIELQEFLDFCKNKIANIFYDLEIKIQPSDKKWDQALFIQVDKTMLYQALENAIENSLNAKATQVKIQFELEDKHVVIKICDNGEGFKDQEKINRLLPRATGCFIIKENMRLMGAETNYVTDGPSGVTLKLIFPVRNE